MGNYWTYFDIVVDLQHAPLTPFDETLESPSAEPEALLTMNLAGSLEATFIYWMDGTPRGIIRHLEQCDHVIRAEAFSYSEDQFGLYVHTEMNDRYLLNNLTEYPVFIDTPVDYGGEYEATVRITTPEDNQGIVLEKIKTRTGVHLESFGICLPTLEEPLAILTDRQKEILRAAIRNGYYEIPRQIGHRELGKLFGISPKTVGEHLRKIESRLISHTGFDIGSESFSPPNRISVGTSSGR